MAELLRHIPPEYDARSTYENNFPRFLDWASSLRNPSSKILDIAKELDFGIRRHPLGFLVVYLSERHEGLWTGSSVTGVARADIFEPGRKVREDIHSHGFDFVSGVVGGTLINEVHYPAFGPSEIPDGEGYVGYETKVGFDGVNHTQQVTDGATISIPLSASYEINAGKTYTLKARDEFHSVSVPGETGAVTIFCKTPAEGDSLVLRRPDQGPPPDTY